MNEKEKGGGGLKVSKDYLKTKIGIIGGGQLGKMMILEAKKMGFYVTVLDPTLKCPCHTLCDEHIVAGFDDYEAIKTLALKSDVVTYEFEHISYEALLKLEEKGVKVYPTAASLKIIQNKFEQKKTLVSGEIPVPEFVKIDSLKDMELTGEKFGYPFVLKTCTGGYDGKGNAFVKNAENKEKAFNSLGGGKVPLMAEKMVDFKMEISVLACRGTDKNIAVYPVGDNRHRNNILHETVVPACISEEITKKAMDIAGKVMNVFDGIGMFCVEMFVTKNGDVLVNEVAPRPHNSGHYSIEACVTSQFENHIRAVSGLPLGDTTLIRPAVMINILGSDKFSGDAFVEGCFEALSVPGVKLHIYGKEKTSPGRKMGHLTVTAESVETALENARSAFEKIRVISKQ